MMSEPIWAVASRVKSSCSIVSPARFVCPRQTGNVALAILNVMSLNAVAKVAGWCSSCRRRSVAAQIERMKLIS